VLLESHGDLVKADDLLYVMQRAESNNVGMIWDFLNMWAITKESPSEVYHKLKNHIFHVHVKDATFIDNKLRYVIIGNGTAPAKEAVQLLFNSGYKGYYSFEWEKQWHPEIEEPEIALAAYPVKMNQYFSGI
jgi:sugar phosphate isomerase/epimerase